MRDGENQITLEMMQQKILMPITKSTRQSLKKQIIRMKYVSFISKCDWKHIDKCIDLMIQADEEIIVEIGIDPLEEK